VLLHAVGYGANCNKHLMLQLADLGSGIAYFPFVGHDFESMKNSFRLATTLLGTIVAQSVKVKVQLPSHIKLKCFAENKLSHYDPVTNVIMLDIPVISQDQQLDFVYTADKAINEEFICTLVASCGDLNGQCSEPLATVCNNVQITEAMVKAVCMESLGACVVTTNTNLKTVATNQLAWLRKTTKKFFNSSQISNRELLDKTDTILSALSQNVNKECLYAAKSLQQSLQSQAATLATAKCGLATRQQNMVLKSLVNRGLPTTEAKKIIDRMNRTMTDLKRVTLILNRDKDKLTVTLGLKKVNE